jgi:hypothetical protein
LARNAPSSREAVPAEGSGDATPDLPLPQTASFTDSTDTVTDRSGAITLTTDFGRADIYVGVMKGVIAEIAPAARVVDLTHDIQPFDAVEAAFQLAAAFRWFPRGAVHVVVVDPGVGASRDIVAMAAGGHLFVAPDTGILAPIADREGCDRIVRVTEPRYFLPAVSRTFHGRDVFAPVAAHLSRGVGLDELGPEIAGLRPLDTAGPAAVPGGVRGAVIRWDHFGNLVTNIPADALPESPLVRIGDRSLRGLSATFSDVPAGEPLAYVGSFGFLEIAVHRGDARRRLRVRRGDPVTVVAEEAT